MGYLSEVTSGNWTNNHSVTYNGLLWLSVQLTGGVGALTLLQTVATAAAIGYVVTGLHRLGVPRVPLVLAGVMVVALPPVGGFILCVWKDVPFVIAQVFLLGTLARLVRAGRDSGQSRDSGRRAYPWRLFAVLGAELLAVCLFRPNGIVVTAIIVTLCALLLPGARLKMIAAGAVAGAAATLATVVVFPAIGVRNTVSEAAIGSFFSYSDIAVAYVHDPRSFTAADLAVMTKVASLDHWRTGADCYDGDPLVFTPGWDREAAVAHQSELIGVWWTVLRRNPADVIATHVCRGSLAWRPTSTANLRRNPAPWSMQTTSSAIRSPREVFSERRRSRTRSACGRASWPCS